MLQRVSKYKIQSSKTLREMFHVNVKEYFPYIYYLEALGQHIVSPLQAQPYGLK